MKKNKFKILVSLIVLLFIGIRTINLGSDISNSDAARWHRRSIMFLNALKKGDFGQTYQRYHPGVTLMWINSFVKQVSFSYQLTYTNTPKTLENADYYPIQHGLSKGANILVLTGLLVLQIYGLKSLFNKKTALIYAFLISVEPYLIGINRWFHQTSFEVFFGFTSVIFILLWNKERKFSHLVISAITLSLSILSKVTSLILGPVFIYVFIKDFIQQKDIKPLLIYSFILLGSIFALFPALWVQPKLVILKIYDAITNAVQSGYGNKLTPLISIFYYVIIFGFKLSPITLAVFAFSLFYFKKFKDENILAFLATLLIYLIFLTASNKKIDRYFLALIPYIIVISASYLSNISKNITNFTLGTAGAFLLFVVLSYHPVYSAYYSPIFGGAKKAVSLGIYENSGEYFAQAAFYLNQKGRDKLTYVPDNIESFNYFYKGNTQIDLIKQPNYIVSSLDKDRKTTDDLEKCDKLDKILGPKNFGAVYIYECK